MLLVKKTFNKKRNYFIEDILETARFQEPQTINDGKIRCPTLHHLVMYKAPFTTKIHSVIAVSK